MITSLDYLEDGIYASALPVPANAPGIVAESGFIQYYFDGEATSDSSEQQTRSYFPETWLWQFADISLVKDFFLGSIWSRNTKFPLLSFRYAKNKFLFN